jgi:hypothetical protein
MVLSEWITRVYVPGARGYKKFHRMLSLSPRAYSSRDLFMHSLHDIQFVTHSSSVIALPHSLQISARGTFRLSSTRCLRESR